MKFTLDEIIKATEGKVIFQKNLLGSFSTSTDTRTIGSDDVYLPLKGEHFDGHDFIDKAIENLCRGYFINSENETNILNKNCHFIISVKDTQEAYLKLANRCRREINPILIGITGSSGKTTTKEMVYSVLSQKYKTHKSKLNHNNEIGLCQTLLSMPEDTEFAVIEMGMRGLGEIELLSKYAQPDIAIITNIGTSHIGRLGSIKNIARAKCEITSYLHKEGTFIGFDDDLLKNTVQFKGDKIFYGLNSYDFFLIKSNDKGSQFKYRGEEYKLNVPGEYNIINALAAIETGLKAGIEPILIAKGLDKYSPIDNRCDIFSMNNGAIVINDTYNANPDSMKAAIDMVIGAYADKNITLVLGNMEELGDFEAKYHRELGNYLNGKHIQELVTIGNKAKLIARKAKNKDLKINSFNNNQEAVEYLRENINSDSVILLKASRSMEFDKIAEKLKAGR